MDTLSLQYPKNLQLLLLLCVTGSHCYKSLMKSIPNAAYVMNPCDSEEPWEGIGHFLPGGFGKRNKFGLDFKRYDLLWSKMMCMEDSDGDGRTNGEELGDPNCQWIADGNVVLSTSNITHPGICEPLESELCQQRNSWLKCNTKFECAAVEEPGTKNLTVRLPPMAVPVKDTTHICMIFDLPQDGDYHMVATQPYLDNKKLMHHILVYGCKDDQEPKHKVNEPYECAINFDSACKDLLSVWLLGTGGECMHSNAGFRIGSHGYTRAGIQIHWENQQRLEGEVDSSGTTIFYTPHLRQYDAGILFIGQDHMIIPPGKPRHVEVGTCYPECTRRKFSEPLHVTFALNHMHYLGKEMRIELIRDNSTVAMITNEKGYDFDTPLLIRYEQPITIRPGDEVRTTCVYDSTSRDLTTRGGSGYLEEMCYGFLTFYPKKAVHRGATFCTSWKTIPICQFELDNTVEGCNFRQVHNMSNPETKKLYGKVMKHCRPFGPCYTECLATIREVIKQPCYHGNMWEWSRNKILKKDVNDNETAEWFKFYAAIDSCLGILNNGHCTNKGSNSVSNFQLNFCMYLLLVLLVGMALS